MRKLKILLSAYGFEPGRGSELGIGWNIARIMAQNHDVWVLTRGGNRALIELELLRRPIPGLHVIYYDLPRWLPGSEKFSCGRIQVHYHLWQLGVYFIAKQWHQRIKFDLANHLTFGKYWAPSLISLLPIPFIWGPIVGGESLPFAFWKHLGAYGTSHALLRMATRWLEEWDPLVRLTARRTNLALTPSYETALRLKRLGVQRVEFVQTHGGINVDEYTHLRNLKPPKAVPFRFLSSGRLVPWKGIHLAIRALAQANLPEAEYWIEGSGPQGRHLAALAKKMGIAHQVQFFEGLSRIEAWACLEQCHVLLHPSLHNLFTNICVEAMAAGRPIIGFCVDPATPSQITPTTGVNIIAHDPQQAIGEMAHSMQLLAQNDSLRASMGRAGQERVASLYLWENKCLSLERNYFRVVENTFQEDWGPPEIGTNDMFGFPQSEENHHEEEAIHGRTNYAHSSRGQRQDE